MRRPADICRLTATLTMTLTLGWVAPGAVLAQPTSRPTTPATHPSTQPSTQPSSQPAAQLRALSRQVELLRRTMHEQQQKLAETRGELADITEAQASASKRKTFQLYGFFDVAFQKVWLPGKVVGEGILPTAPGFVFTNLNLYFDFTPHSDWRVLTELRFALNPLGDTKSYENATTGKPYERVNVTSNDPAHFGARFDYGSVAIERAQIEWSRFELLSVTAGLFLTPFGIWNIDHGSPVQILVSQPQIYARRSEQLFPERQLGLMLHGRVPIGQTLLSYAATLSNGSGPIQTLRDVDTDKAIGARVALEARGAINWKVGVSAYVGLNSDFKMTMQTSPSVDYATELTVQFREVALGADVRLEAGRWTLLGEVLANLRYYRAGHRPPAFALGLSGDGFAPDHASIGGYAVAAYRLPLGKLDIRPYLELGYVDRVDLTRNDDVFEMILGVNWRIVPSVVFKIEGLWFHSPFLGGRAPSVFTGIGNLLGLQMQLAVAF